MSNSPKKIKRPVPLVIPYPTRGVMRGSSFSHPPQLEGHAPGVSLFCREALNVRSFDQFSDRLRGGPRHGTHKWHKDQVDGVSMEVQDLNSLIPFGSYNPNEYEAPPTGGTGNEDMPKALDPGGSPGVPPEVPPGIPWIPGMTGDGPWYVNPKKCDDDSTLDKWIEWGLLPLYLNVFEYDGECYYANPFDPLTDEPPAILTTADALLGELRMDSCDICSEVPAACAGTEPATLYISGYGATYFGDVRAFHTVCEGPDDTYAFPVFTGALPKIAACNWYSDVRVYGDSNGSQWYFTAQLTLVAGQYWQLVLLFHRTANFTGTVGNEFTVTYRKAHGRSPRGGYSLFGSDQGAVENPACYQIRDTILIV